MLRMLLDMSSQRIIKILEILAAHEDWTTSAGLSALIGTSERTVSKDIAVLKKRWGEHLKIEVSTKKGIRMHNRNVSSIKKVFIDLFNDSVALRWLEEIFFSPGNGIEFYEEKLFVSRSTLGRLLPRINDFLAKRGMIVQRRNNRYRISAKDEQYLRQFYAGFLLELKGFDLKDHRIDLDPGVPGSIIRKILLHNLESQEYAMVSADDISMVYYIMFYIVSLIRENQGCAIPSDYQTEKEISRQDLTFIKSLFPNISETNLRPIHQFIVSQYNGWDSDEEKALVTQEAEVFSQTIFRAAKTVPDGKMLRRVRFVLSSAYLTAKSRSYQTSTLFDRIYYFSVTLKQYNAAAYRLIEENMNVFSQNIHFDMSLKIPEVLFWTCLICPEFSKFTPVKTALVISDFGSQHADFLAKFISDFFNQNHTAIHITAAHYPQVLAEPIFEKYDIVLTTIPHLPAAHKNIILINDCPSHENLFEIYKALYR